MELVYTLMYRNPVSQILTVISLRCVCCSTEAACARNLLHRFY
ncbi:hypothetical protein VPHK460_0303 [Vibrio phage K460]